MLEVVAQKSSRSYVSAFFPAPPLFVYNCDAALFAKGWIGQHHVEPLTRIRNQTVPRFHRALPSADAVKMQVHHTEPYHTVHEVHTVKGPVSEKLFLFPVKLIALAR